jgi:hypothetical protein
VEPVAKKWGGPRPPLAGAFDHFLRAAPFAAVGQVGAHGGARRLGVLALDGVEDVLVLVDHALQVLGGSSCASSGCSGARAG